MTTNLSATPAQHMFSTKRIVIIDVLRAFALFGIIINHITASYLAGPPPRSNPQFNVFSEFDSAVSTGSFILTFGKFFTIFSFLFGLSFAIQMSGGESKKSAFTARFFWRLIVLFVIGFIHNMFYSGDILVIYALLGVFLLPAKFLGNRIVVPLAILLILNAPGLVQDIIKINAPAPTQAQIAGQVQAGKAFAKISNEQYRIKQSGNLAELIEMNAIDGLIGKFFFQVSTGRLWITFGLFLLGLYAGRKKVFDYNTVNMRFFKKLCLWSGLIAIISTLVALFYGNPFGGASNFMQVLGNFSFSVHQASLSAFYLSGIVLLYWKAKGYSKLNYLAPLGQMGLTTYLVQTVFGLLLFYGVGFGMMGNLGVAVSIVIGIAFFIMQIFFAKWWMSNYRYGLVEWIWRSLTYFKIQPMKKLRDHQPFGTIPQPRSLLDTDVEQRV